MNNNNNNNSNNNNNRQNQNKNSKNNNNNNNSNNNNSNNNNQPQEKQYDFDGILTGTGVWFPYATYAVPVGKPLAVDLSDLDGYWLRFRASAPCAATAQLRYE